MTVQTNILLILQDTITCSVMCIQFKIIYTFILKVKTCFPVLTQIHTSDKSHCYSLLINSHLQCPHPSLVCTVQSVKKLHVFDPFTCKHRMRCCQLLSSG